MKARVCDCVHTSGCVCLLACVRACVIFCVYVCVTHTGKGGGTRSNSRALARGALALKRPTDKAQVAPSPCVVDTASLCLCIETKKLLSKLASVKPWDVVTVLYAIMNKTNNVDQVLSAACSTVARFWHDV